MSVEVKIPQIGFSTQEGTLVEWLVPDGGQVAEGAPLYTLELDKSVQEVTSPASRQAEGARGDGQVYPVGALIGEIV